MRIGRLDRKITLQFRTLSQNAYGEAVAASYSNLAVWATIDTKATGTKETVSGGLETSSQNIIFLIRYSSDVSSITSGDRVSYGGKTYDIEVIQEVGRNLSLRLICKLVQ